MPYRRFSSWWKSTALFKEWHDFVTNQGEKLLVIISLRCFKWSNYFGNGQKYSDGLLIGALQLISQKLDTSVMNRWMKICVESILILTSMANFHFQIIVDIINNTGWIDVLDCLLIKVARWKLAMHNQGWILKSPILCLLNQLFYFLFPIWLLYLLCTFFTCLFSWYLGFLIVWLRLILLILSALLCSLALFSFIACCLIWGLILILLSFLFCFFFLFIFSFLCCIFIIVFFLFL